MKPGETIMIFTDPFECKMPEGQATLIEKLTVGHNSITDNPDFEYWSVEFLDSPGNIYPRIIKSNQ